MNEELKAASDALTAAINAEAEARASMIAIIEKANAAARARDTTAADLAALQSNFEAAAEKHAQAVAAVELGEEADTDATAAELATARTALDREAELAQTLRAQTAVVEALEARYLASHGPLNQAVATVKAAKVELLRLRSKHALRDAERLRDTLAERAAEMVALSGVLSELGSGWPGGSVMIDDIVNPSPNLVAAQRRALLAAIEPAAA